LTKPHRNPTIALPKSGSNDERIITTSGSKVLNFENPVQLFAKTGFMDPHGLKYSLEQT